MSTNDEDIKGRIELYEKFGRHILRRAHGIMVLEFVLGGIAGWLVANWREFHIIGVLGPLLALAFAIAIPYLFYRAHVGLAAVPYDQLDQESR